MDAKHMGRSSWLAIAALIPFLTACSGNVAVSPTITVTATVTAEVTVTTPTPAPTTAPDDAIDLEDAQGIVKAVCLLADAYWKFEPVLRRLPSDPSQLSNAKKKAEEVVFAFDAMEGLLVIGPNGGWSDAAYGLNAIQIGSMIATSRPFFVSAAQAKTVDELVNLGMGVLDNPVGPGDVGPFMAHLPQKEAEQLSTCTKF